MPLLDPRALPGTERITVAEGRGYFPVLVKNADGSLLVVYRDGGGHGGAGGFLAAKRSEDAGRTWSEQVTVVNTSAYDDRNPAVGVAPSGAVIVGYFATGGYGPDGKSLAEERRTPPALLTGVVRSEDGGRTWSQAMTWTDAAEWNGMSPYGRIPTLDGGAMAMPIYWMDRSCLLWSHDDGHTWGELSRVSNEINEAAYCVLPDGEWLCLGRKQRELEEHKHLVFRSSDGGRTWRDPKPFATGWRFPGDLTVLTDGSVLASYGYRQPPHGARARRSEDGGKTWSNTELVLDDTAPTGDCGYPSTVVSDGWIVSAYHDAGRFADFYDPTQCRCVVVRYREEETITRMAG